MECGTIYSKILRISFYKNIPITSFIASNVPLKTSSERNNTSVSFEFIVQTSFVLDFYEELKQEESNLKKS